LIASVALIARLLLAAVFGVAGVGKLLDTAGSRKSIQEFGVPGFLAPAVAVLLPLAELACAVALIPARSAWWGAAGSLGLLISFVVAIAVNMLLGRTPDCHCFGQFRSSPVGWTTLFRNLLLTAIAVLVLWQRPGNAVSSVGWTLGGFSGTGEAVFILALVVVGQAVVGVLALYQILRQNGRTLERLQTIEAKLGIVPTLPQAQEAGLPIGSAAPGFSLGDLDGALVTLDSFRQNGKSILLFFGEPGCGACDTMLPDVGRWQREHVDSLAVVPISRGTTDANLAKAKTYGVQGILLQRSREVAEAYRVVSTPSAVLVTEGLIASALAVGADAIRGLVNDATMPATLRKGDRVPSLPLRDLNGGTLDLANLEGHRTMLLFWNPSCGFCEAMLEDLKAWEGARANDAPELVVISSGSPKVNREQGFRSRVLLDARFEAGGRFGAGGTPSAVLIDEMGRVASGVRVGSEPVLEMAGAALARIGR